MKALTEREIFRKKKQKFYLLYISRKSRFTERERERYAGFLQIAACEANSVLCVRFECFILMLQLTKFILFLSQEINCKYIVQINLVPTFQVVPQF
jgi:hypothetical protein